MKDCVGRELSVGQEVFYATLQNQKPILVRGVVLAVFEDSVQVKGARTLTIKNPNRLVIVPTQFS